MAGTLIASGLAGLGGLDAAWAQMDQPVSGGGVAPSAPATTGAPVGQPAGGGTPTGPAGPGGLGFMWIIMLMFLVMIGMSILTGRKEKRKRKDLMTSLKRKDVVQTSAGIIGTIENLGEHDVTLCVDDSTDTRIKFNKAAIQAVLKSGRGGGGGGGAGSASDSHAAAAS